MTVNGLPIEVGPSVAVKQFCRALAALRGIGDYDRRERSSPMELMRSVAGSKVERVGFDGDGSDGPYRSYGHKGFHFRDLEREIRERLTIVRRSFTPLPVMGPLLNSQAWSSVVRASVARRPFGPLCRGRAEALRHASPVSRQG